jgi:outer membrane protein OmpA-like peptidoglycan-associated protein
MKNLSKDAPLKIDHFKTNELESNSELKELRHLILGQELPHIGPEEISKVLPEAIHLSAAKNTSHIDAMVPTVEDAIKSSIDKDLNVLSEALFPVIGPATRKAVSVAIKNLTQALNQGLENSLSPQSFKWRFEAMRTGKSFAEVVLLRTLLYQVEQVLLIHKETGLVLHQLQSDNAETQDPELVSAMLTAIQDFVKDSFRVQQGRFLGSLEFGDLTLWIEEGPGAVLACSIRGTAPQALRLEMQQTLEQVHILFQKPLATFQGDNSAFLSAEPYLQNCLQAQYKAKSEKSSPIPKIVLGLLLVGLSIWGVLHYRDQQKWSAYVQTLEKQPGIVILHTNRFQGKHRIVGMRDPMAASPVQLLQNAGYRTGDVVSEWKPFISLEPKLMEQRVRSILQPPPQVSLKVDELGRLQVTGLAQQQWIKSMQQLAPSLMGISQINTSNLQSSEEKSFQSLQQQVEQTVIVFAQGRTEVEGVPLTQLEKTATQLKSLIQLAQILDRKIEIHLEGFADAQGPIDVNRFLSRERAEFVRGVLSQQGINPTFIKALSNYDPENKDLANLSITSANSRKVTLKILTQ